MNHRIIIIIDYIALTTLGGSVDKTNQPARSGISRTLDSGGGVSAAIGDRWWLGGEEVGRSVGRFVGGSGVKLCSNTPTKEGESSKT